MTVAGQKSMSRRAACPLSRLAGEGWGEGGSVGCANLISPQAAKPPHPSRPPPDGGRNKIADTVKGRLKFKAWFQTTFFHNQTTLTIPRRHPRPRIREDRLRRESISNSKKLMFEKQLQKFKSRFPPTRE